ncbi:hypothetical protein [Nonlabens dokdonensis]|uniref:hypothetical protein n=1 Tax=Nonlabens dokdonensis TaxID=328515 RepID=UPI0011B38790|nr:hypothetical protein [Nonlabens dokdonensis]
MLSEKGIYKMGGILLILISISTSFNSYKKYDAIFYGRDVIVPVLDIPISCKSSNKSVKAYFTFIYNGIEYSKNIKGEYCGLLERNKTVKLKINSDNSVFVYPNEKMTMQIISIVILFIIGILFLLKQNEI